MSASPTSLADFEKAGEVRHPTVVEAFAAVMADVQSVSKDGRNTHQNYNFRGIDGVMNAVGPALRTHGVVIVPRVLDGHHEEVEVGEKRTLMRQATLTVEFTVIGPNGDTFSGATVGEAMDSGDKATAKAHSVAYRTFLLQALTIPTMEPDPDEASYQRSARPAARLLMAPGHVDALRKLAGDRGVDLADVVIAVTDGRTDDPSQLYADEKDAAKDAVSKAPATVPAVGVVGDEQ